MDLMHLQDIAASNRWGAIGPEIFLAVVALLLLAVELFSRRRETLVPALAIWSQIGLFVGMLWSISTEPKPMESNLLFGGLVAQSVVTDVMRLFFVGCSVFVCHLATIYLRARALAKTEFYHIILLVTASFMLLVQSHNLLMLFVALETLTIGFYVLVAYGRNSTFSLEAGLKYLVLGATSSAILLFGITLIYGAVGNPIYAGSSGDPMDFGAIATFAAAETAGMPNASSVLFLIGASMVVAGIAFKIGALPFQIWIPDVYQGAPTPITAFLAVSSKAGGFFLLYLLITGPFSGLEAVMHPLLSVIIVATIVFGNITALGQRNVKRIMGMSGIAHAGILLLGVAAASKVDWAFPAVFAYLVIYAVASFAVFEVMAVLALPEDSDQELEHYSGLMKKSPFLGSVLAIGLGSLAGIPPLAGFIAKFLVFYAAFQAELYGLLMVALFGVVISIYYYFGWMRAAVMQVYPSQEELAAPIGPLGWGTRVIMLALSVVTVGFGLYQGAFAGLF